MKSIILFRKINRRLQSTKKDLESCLNRNSQLEEELNKKMVEDAQKKEVSPELSRSKSKQTLTVVIAQYRVYCIFFSNRKFQPENDFPRLDFFGMKYSMT